MERTRNRTGSTVSIPFVRRAAIIPLVFALGCHTTPAAKTSAAPEDVADEFSFVVNPLDHARPQASIDHDGDVTTPPLVLPHRDALSAPPAMRGALRATITPTSVDYATVPLMHVTPSVASTFVLRKQHVVPRCGQHMVPVERDEWSMGGNVSVKSIVRVDGTLLPPVEWLSGGHFLDDGSELDRLTEPRLRSAEWTTIETPKNGPTLSVTTYQGSFDPASLSASAKLASTAKAVAIVPGEVYAFRRCAEACHLSFGDAARVEEIQLVGPPAAWIGSSGTVEEARLDQQQPFTLLSTRVSRGSSSSLVLDYTVEAAKSSRGEATVGPDKFGDPFVTVSVMIDVVWPADEDAPTLTIYRGEYAARIANQYPRVDLGGRPDCTEEDFVGTRDLHP